MMAKGFHVTAFRAGLLALTALASSVPAIAQERGNWGGRAGVERAAGERGGGERAGGGERGGGWQRGGDQAGGGANRGWRDNGASARPAPQPGQSDTRNWRGDSNARWQNRTPRPDAVPVPRADQTPGGSVDNGARYRQSPSADRNNWRNGAAGRDDQNRRGRENRGGNDWNRNDGNDGNRWNNSNNRPGAVYGNGGVNRAYGNQANRQGDWNRNYARPNNGWQAGNGRINSNDRWREQARWNRDWRRDSRYDWSGYRQYNRNAYRLPAYRAPYGWSGGYSRFSIGVFLGSPLFGSSYWIDDPYNYRLPQAYGTLRWIRYYDDALLVDIRDGYVVDVLHDFFW